MIYDIMVVCCEKGSTRVAGKRTTASSSRVNDPITLYWSLLQHRLVAFIVTVARQRPAVFYSEKLVSITRSGWRT